MNSPGEVASSSSWLLVTRWAGGQAASGSSLMSMMYVRALLFFAMSYGLTSPAEATPPEAASPSQSCVLFAESADGLSPVDRAVLKSGF